MTKDTYHHGELRQKIIEEALSWIEQEDIFSLSLRGIARRIGVSHNAPYRHFSDKESLLIEIAEIGFNQLYQSLQQPLINSRDHAQQKLETIGVAYIQYAVQNQAYYRVMFSDRVAYPKGNRPKYSKEANQQKNAEKYQNLNQVSEKAFSVLLQTIETGQQTGVFMAEDSYQLALVCWSLVHGVSMLAIDGQLKICDRSSILELAKMATNIVSKGLKK
jgi:AcrR family transcriptional regulator